MLIMITSPQTAFVLSILLLSVGCITPPQICYTESGATDVTYVGGCTASYITFDIHPETKQYQHPARTTKASPATILWLNVALKII